MDTHNPRPIFHRQNLVQLTAFLPLSVVVFLGFAVSAAHPEQEGREFKNEVHKNLPVKVKIKSEKSFKDLKNKGWLRELEIEVKNTGSKPIYFIQLSIGLPDVILEGHEYGFGVSYGRRELIYPETPVESGDVPIMPGETVTLKVGEQTVKGYEYGRDQLREHGDPKKVVCLVKVVKFGDGTALWGPDGTLPPPEPRGKASNDLKQKNGAVDCRSSSALSAANAPDKLLGVNNSWQPASLLRAYFLPPGDATSPSLVAARDDCGCHSVAGCKWGHTGFRNCPSCVELELAVIFSGGVWQQRALSALCN